MVERMRDLGSVSLLGVFVPENLQFNFGKERGFADFPATILNSVYKYQKLVWRA
jgi:hypothetical protein